MNDMLAPTAFILASLFITKSVAAGFDCSKARTTIEFTICADPELSYLDSELNRVYDFAQHETAGVNAETGVMSDPVAKEQKAWILNTRNKCKDADCLKRAYSTRIAQIKKNWPSE